MLFSLYYILVVVFYVYLPEVMSSKIKNFTGGIGNVSLVTGQFALLFVNKIISSYKSLLII